MARTLAAGLQTQLDSETRKPIITLTSQASTADIPFTGSRLHNLTVSEKWPAPINHSSGRYVFVYSRQIDANQTHLYIQYSATDRATWGEPYRIADGSVGGTNPGSVHYEYPSCVELSNGHIGVLVTERIGGVQKLRMLVVNYAGLNFAPLQDVSTAGLFYESTVIKTAADGTYLAFAVALIAGKWEFIRCTHAAGSTWSSAGWTTAVKAITSQASTAKERRRPFLYEAEISAGVYNQWLFWDLAEDTSSNDKNRNIYSIHGADKFAGGTINLTKRTTFSNVWESAEKASMVQLSPVPSQAAYFAYVKRSVSILIDQYTAQPNRLLADRATRPFWHMIYYDTSYDYIIVVGEDGTNGVQVFRASDFTLVKRYLSYQAPLATVPSFRSTYVTTIASSYYRDGKLVILWSPEVSAQHGLIEILDLSNDSIKTVYPRGTPDATFNLIPGSLRLTTSSDNLAIEYILGSIYIESDLIYLVEDGTQKRLWSFSIASASGDVSTEVTPVKLGNSVPSNYPTNNTFVGAGNGGNNYSYFWDKSGYLYIANRTGRTAAQGIAPNQQGFITKIKYSDGTFIKTWSKSTATGVNAVDKPVAHFPERGAVAITVSGDYVLFSAYHNGGIIPSEDYDGLMVLNQLTDTIETNTNAIPIGTLQNPPVRQTILSISPKGDGRYFVSTPRSTADGVATYTRGALAIYDPNTNSIDPHDHVTNPGWPVQPNLMPAGVGWAVWDSARNRVYQTCDASVNADGGSYGGLLIYDLDGDILQPYYQTMSALAGTPSLGTAAVLINGTEDGELTIFRNGAGTGLAAMWTRRAEASRFDLYFDEALGLFDLMPYLDESEEISWGFSLEAEPNSLNFALVPGGLFDPTNLASLHRNKAERGRKIVLTKGEDTLAGQLSDTAIVAFADSGSNSYQKGQLTSRRVQCYDMTKPLYGYQVPMSAPYGWEGDPYPSSVDGSTGILNHLAVTIGRLPQSSVTIPEFTTETIKAQLSDMTVMEMIQVFCNRYQRVPFVDAYGKLTVKEIATDLPITDTFSTNKLTVSVNPEASEAEDTNRVTVKGTEAAQREVQYAEQTMIEPSGIVGWLYKEKDLIYVPYSDDYSIEAVNARMAIVEWGAKSKYPTLESVSPGRALVLQAGGSAPVSGLTAVELSDFYNRHGVQIRLGVYKEWAGIVSTVLSIAAMILLTGLAIGASIPIIGGFFAGAAIKILSALVFTLQLAVIALSKLWFYQVRIFGQPTGTVRLEMQATWNDERKQQRMNNLIIERIEEFPLADSVTVCQLMANWFGLRIQLAETPVTLSMLGHLRQEPGDMIKWKHPESGQLVTSLIHSINYKLKRGEDGYDIQDVKVLGLPE